jgi:hypothetical protein
MRSFERNIDGVHKEHCCVKRRCYLAPSQFKADHQVKAHLPLCTAKIQQELRENFSKYSA